ncbi:MAG: TolB family protein [Rhodococcus sp. (in: high G+C Gram-positive bacteria)]
MLFVLIVIGVLTGCSDNSPPVPDPAIVSFQDGWGQIFVMDADGSDLRQVTPTVADDMSDGLYGSYPALSPDGKQLAYIRGSSIAVLDLDTDETRIVYEGGASQPVYSPDGSTIAFMSGGSISVMNTDGSDVRVIAQEEQRSWRRSRRTDRECSIPSAATSSKCR